MKEKWLNKLQARIESEYDVKAPEGLLDDIKMEMTRRGVVPAHSSTRQKAKTISLWIYRSASVAAIFAVGLYLGDMFIEQSSLPPRITTVLDNKANAISNSSMTETRVNNHAPNIVKLASSVFKGTQTALEDKTLFAGVSSGNMGKGIAINDKTSESQQATNSSEQEKVESTDSSRTVKWESCGNLEAENVSYVRKDHSSRLSILTSYSGAAGASIHAERPLLKVANPYGEYSPEFSGVNIQDYVTGSGEPKTHTKHRQPVKFGLSVRYNLDNRWSLQAGLAYSNLTSEFSYSKGNESYVVEQNLHYIGLPLNASYSIVKTKRFNVYATVGGEIEKLVKGEAKLAVEDAPQASPKSSAIKEGSPVFSVNAAIGGEYRFSEDLSAYIEPGVSRHFNNGSTVENIYKDRPTNFNLNIGIRVNLNK